MSNLILMLVNKLVTAVFEADEQLCCVRDNNSEAENLIQVLLLQAITWSKIRLTVNNFILFRKTLLSKNLSQKIMFLSIFTESTIYNSLNVNKKKLSILNLIKNIQEFNLQYRQIFNQLCEKLKKKSFICSD